MKTRAWFYFMAVILLLDPCIVRAEEFQIFDGHIYNGKYYPRIDVIEWNDSPGSPTYMDFHIYSKGKPVDLSFSLEATQKKKVMNVNYLFTERDEHQCRRVLAPAHFSEGFLVYKDLSDPDYDSIIVSMHKMPEKKGRVQITLPTYAACATAEPERQVAAEDKGHAGAPSDQKRQHSDKSAIKSKSAAVPFGDW